jgi:hypothetical protein
VLRAVHCRVLQFKQENGITIHNIQNGRIDQHHEYLQLYTSSKGSHVFAGITMKLLYQKSAKETSYYIFTSTENTFHMIILLKIKR